MRQVVCIDKACLLEPSKEQKGGRMAGFPNVQVSQGSAGLGPDAEVVLLPLQQAKEKKQRRVGLKKRIIISKSNRLKKRSVIKTTNGKTKHKKRQSRRRRASKQTQVGGSRGKQRRKCIKRKHG